MKRFFVLTVLSFSLFACNEPASENNHTISDVKDLKDDNDEMDVNDKSDQSQTVYAWVDKLRLRAKPDLKAKEIMRIAEGAAMFFDGEISPNKIKVKLRGRDIEAPFYKITTVDGITGWLFAGALSNIPVDVESYRVAFAFDTRNLSDDEDSGDFGYYLYDAGQMLVGTGIDLIYIDEKFHSVEIKNGKGDIIGVENIAPYVKEHGTGIICLEKGKEAVFVDYDPSMGKGVLEAFGVE